MSKLSQLAETLIGSEIVKLGNAINERIRNGETIYNFTIGDFNPSEFPIPVELEQLIIEAYQQKKTSYPAAEGILDLRKSISQFIQEWEGLHFTPAEIQVASGGRPLIYALFKVIVDKGDKVVYGVPSWNNNHYVHLTEGQHCEVNCLPENDFMPTVEDLKPHIKGASLICLCTPQNPTGTTLGNNALAEICELILEENASRGPEEKKLYLMFDQMYWTLTYGDTVHYNPLTLNPAMKPYTIFIDGISKVFSATGVRVGWALGPENVIAKMKAILSHLGAWAPMAEQHAVAKYLPMKEAIGSYLTNFKAEIAFRLQNIYEGIIALKKKGFKVDAIAPQAAIYLTIQIDLVGSKTVEGTILATQSDVTQYILSEAKIAIVPFSAFGAGANSSWYRLSVGTCRKQDIPTVLSQLGTALEKLS